MIMTRVGSPEKLSVHFEQLLIKSFMHQNFKKLGEHIGLELFCHLSIPSYQSYILGSGRV